MPGRIVAKIIGELSETKTKGKAFLKELGKKLSPKAIADYECAPKKKR